MKKLIIIFLLLLCGCENKSILNTVYISSIGLDYVDGEYIGYFYSPPAKDLGKNGDSNNESVIYKIKDKELANVFDVMLNTSPANINFFHLKTMILSNNFNAEEQLLSYFRFSNKVSYNFHVLCTDDNLEELYNYKSVSNISNLYNVLNSPSLIDYKSVGIDKCHFLNFANNFSNKERYNHIPYIKMEYNSLKEEEFQLVVKGYKSNGYIYDVDNFYGITLLSNGNKEISYNNNINILSDYKVTYEVINNICNINIEFFKVSVYGSIDIEEYIESNISFYLDKLLEDNNSLYFINQYNYLYNKNVISNKYVINIK